MSNITTIQTNTLTAIGDSIKEVMGDKAPSNFTISKVPELIKEIAQNSSSELFFCLSVTLKSGGKSEFGSYIPAYLGISISDFGIQDEIAVGGREGTITKNYMAPKGAYFYISGDGGTATGYLNQNCSYLFEGSNA